MTPTARAPARRPLRALIARFGAAALDIPRTLAVARRVASALLAEVPDAPLVLTVADDADPARVGALVAAVRPLRLVLVGPDPLARAGLLEVAAASGAAVEVWTDARALDARGAYALLQAGARRLVVTLDPAPEAALAAVARLVSMRDANRKPGPSVAVRAGAATLPAALDACAARGFAPVLAAGPLDPPVTTDLSAARARAARAGLRDTVTSIDAARAPSRGPCAFPRLALHVGADGALHPCPRHARDGAPLGHLPSLHPAPSGPVPDDATAAARRISVPPPPPPLRADPAVVAALRAAWNGPAARALRAAGRDDPVCAACVYADGGLGYLLG